MDFVTPLSKPQSTSTHSICNNEQLLETKSFSRDRKGLLGKWELSNCEGNLCSNTKELSATISQLGAKTELLPRQIKYESTENLKQKKETLNRDVILAPQKPCFFNNHQKWQINYGLNDLTGTPVFHLMDSYGLPYTVTEFIVEDLDPHFAHKLTELNTPEEQQKCICQYLQERLERANPYQVHVERYGNQLTIRFGGHGLKGGGKWEDLLFSAGQVVIGVGLATTTIATGGGALVGGALISSGLSGGICAYKQKEKHYNESEYYKSTGLGFFSGLTLGSLGGRAGVIFGLAQQVGLGRVNDLSATVVQSIANGGKTVIQEAHQVYKSFRQEVTNKLEAFIPNSTSFVGTDCELQELIPHVVLVHALEAGTWGYYQDADYSLIDDLHYRELCCIKGVLTCRGVMAHHLQLEKREYQDTFERRPHTHWSWNQLVQSHGNYSWDTGPTAAVTAILEPLSTFENSICHKPFGVAPYDTIVFGPHHLSKKSILLIPEYLYDEATSHLIEFNGKIVTYNSLKQNLRTAVIDTLQKYYPETWHICDEKGKLTGNEIRHSFAGYESKTCLMKGDGQVLSLMKNSGYEEEDRISKAMKDYKSTSRRFIGLHAYAPTDSLEKEENVYINSLRRFTVNATTIKGNSLFAGSIQRDANSLAKLGILESLEFYYKILDFDPKTGGYEIATYVLNTAMHADLVSLFYRKHPTENFDFSALDLKMLFEPIQGYLKNLLDDINNIKIDDLDKKQKAIQSFEVYCCTLEDCIRDMKKAKSMTLFLATENEGEKRSINPLCLMVGQDDWKSIEIPDNIEFDLGKNWPHNNALNTYIYKVLRSLPREYRELKKLFLHLCSSSHPRKDNLEEQNEQCQWNFIDNIMKSISSYLIKDNPEEYKDQPSVNNLGEEGPEDRKEKYRLNVIRSVIQYALQEVVYLKLRKSNHSSILPNKLIIQEGWLTDYGLKGEDFTQKTGDCLFDNIAAQLPPGLTTPYDLRQKLKLFMEARRGEYVDFEKTALKIGEEKLNIFAEDWNQHLEGLDVPGVLATELEMKALASMIDYPIVLMEACKKPIIYNIESKKDPIFIHHLNDNRYESCVPIKGLTINDIYSFIKNEGGY